MSMVSFKRGSNLNNLAIADGQFILKTDERSIYIDVGTERLRIGDFVSVANIAALPTAGANTTALYYVEDINCLAKWDGSAWIQINRDTGVKEVKVEGTGNAITAASYDATTRILTLTKGETFATPAVVDSKISDKVGVIEGTVKAYVDAKTEGIASDEALQALTTRITTAEGDIDTLQAAIGPDGSVTQGIADAKKAGTDAQTDVDALEEKVGTIADGKTVSGLIAEAKTQADKGVSDAATAKTAADTAQSGVDNINAKIGTVTEGKTVVEMINDAKAAATYDDTGVKASIKANTDAIGVLNGADTVEGSVAKAVKTAQTTLQGNIDTVAGKVTTLVGSVEGDDAKSARTIASEEVAKIVAGADTAYDTLKEIADWISGHKTDAAAMNSAITVLEAIVDGIGGEGEKATVKAYVDDAISALKIGDYATAADLTALAGRVSTVEGQIATINGDDKTVGSIKKALSDANAYTDGKDNAMNTRVKAVEDAKHTHANKAELDLIETGDKAKWDAAQTNAEATAAAALTAAKKELNTAIGKKADQTALDTVSGNVAANAANITKIMGDANTEGSFAKADAALKTELQSYADTSETDAVNASKAYTDGLLTWGEF